MLVGDIYAYLYMLTTYLAMKLSAYAYILLSTYALCMAKLNFVLPNDVETRFRKAVFEAKGMKKGNLSEALMEAIDLWILEQTSQRKVKK
jgi:hypothetical protein